MTPLLCGHNYIGIPSARDSCLQLQQFSEVKKNDHSTDILCFSLIFSGHFPPKYGFLFSFSVYLRPFCWCCFHSLWHSLSCSLPVLLGVKRSEMPMVSKNEYAADKSHILMAFSGLFLTTPIGITTCFFFFFGHIKLLGWHFQGFLSWRCTYIKYIFVCK